MAKDLSTGITRQQSKLIGAGASNVELFGHVTLVEGYAVRGFTGMHALVALRDVPDKTIAVLTKQHRLQTLLESALTSGYLIAFLGKLLTDPPTPRGGTWNVDVYSTDGVILYSSS